MQPVAEDVEIAEQPSMPLTGKKRAKDRLDRPVWPSAASAEGDFSRNRMITLLPAKSTELVQHANGERVQ